VVLIQITSVKSAMLSGPVRPPAAVAYATHRRVDLVVDGRRVDVDSDEEITTTLGRFGWTSEPD
jgi:hypothetical protein